MISEESDVEQVSSDQEEETEVYFEKVPKNKEFKLKVDSKKLLYTLKEGRTLPYKTSIKGNFS